MLQRMAKLMAFLEGMMLHFSLGKENTGNYSICLSTNMITQFLPLCKWRKSLILYSMLLLFADWKCTSVEKKVFFQKQFEDSDNLAVCLAADNITPIVLKPLWNTNEIQQRVSNLTDFTHREWYHITKQQSKSESRSWKEMPVTSRQLHSWENAKLPQLQWCKVTVSDTTESRQRH